MWVLLVEDDVDGGEILREIFESEGVEVRWARDGHEALELASRGDYSAALVDLSLPDVEGEALIRSLRRMLPRAGIALVTGFPEAVVDAETRRLSDGLFQKPVDPDRLLAFVQRFGGVDAAHAPA